MKLKLILCCGCLLLLLLSQDQARAKPISSLQSLSRLLDEDVEHPLTSEEMDHEQEDAIPIGTFDQTAPELQWARKSRDPSEGALLSDAAGLLWGQTGQNWILEWIGVLSACYD
ncbi:C-type natriuretic peptide precursor [Alligator mississippiensis]|uniref:C-type natriuretic peptide n=1 Tax=Alligator mississippiensis TaxID=8496 RepID=A0A151N3U5_ALLMI|nr:C-type natriuretic peptide precursor [Alligator mississippiensis]